MIGQVEKRVFEIVSPFNGRSWRTFKRGPSLMPVMTEGKITSIIRRFKLRY